MTFGYRIGRVLRAHGLQGDVTVQLFRPRALSEKRKQPKKRELVAVAETERALRSVQLILPDRALVGFEGIDDRDAAARLEGAYLDVDPEHLPPLLTDELDALFGKDAVDPSGARIGPIVDIRDNGAQALLVVGEEEILIPAPFVVEIREHEVVIDAPDGLIDLYRS